MNRTKKEQPSSSKPKTPAPIKPTQPPSATNKPNITPQKEVPKAQSVWGTLFSSKAKTSISTKISLLLRPSFSTSKAKPIAQKEVHKEQPAPETPVEPKLDNGPPELPIIEFRSIFPQATVMSNNAEDSFQKRIPKVLYHKPSLTRVLARQAKNSIVQYKSMAKIAIKYKVSSWREREREAVLDIWRAIEKPMRVHRWKSLRSIDFDWEIDFPDHQSPPSTPTDSGKVLGEMINRHLQDVLWNLADLKVRIEGPAQLMVMMEPGLLLFSEGIGHYLMNLQCLTLSLRVGLNETEDDSLARFGYILSHRLVHLTFLDIALHGEFSVTDEGFGKFVTQISFCSPNLRRLGLELSGFSDVTEIGFKKLKYLFCTVQNKLKALKLIFSDCPNFTYEVLTNILLDLQGAMPNLTSFSLCPDRLTDEGAAILGLTLANYYPNLEEISLRLSRCYKVTPDGLSSLGSNITGKLNRLQAIKMHGTPFRATDNDLRAIGNEILLKFPNIKVLELTFMACNMLTSAGLEFLASEVIAKLKNLNQLSLNFSQCHALSEKVFRMLGNHISTDLINLRRLSLNFSTWRIHDNYLGEFISKITTNLLNLRSLNLNFYLCENIKENGIKYTIVQIANISTRLKELSLNFKKHEKKETISNQCKQEAKELLKSIPTLNLEF